VRGTTRPTKPTRPRYPLLTALLRLHPESPCRHRNAIRVRRSADAWRVRAGSYPTDLPHPRTLPATARSVWGHARRILQEGDAPTMHRCGRAGRTTQGAAWRPLRPPGGCGGGNPLTGTAL